MRFAALVLRQTGLGDWVGASGLVVFIASAFVLTHFH